MPQRLSGRQLRAAFVLGLVAAVSSAAVSSAAVSSAAVSPLPIALLASFDEAIALVHEAAEQRIVELEQRPAPARASRVAGLFARFERDVTAAGEDARAALARAIVTVELSPARRAAVLASIDHQLAEARRARWAASDPAVRAEYVVTCRQLRALRAVV